MSSTSFVISIALLLAPPLLGGCGDDPEGALGDGSAADGPADAGPDTVSCPPLDERPSRRSEHVMVFAGDHILIHGGTTAVPENCEFPAPEFTAETWRYDIECGIFSRVEHEGGPGPRVRAMGAWDPVDSRVLIFGGRYRAGTLGPYSLLDDLWALDDSGWTLVAAGGPGGRVGGAMGVDPTDGRVWIFGGDSSTSGLSYDPRGDTWSYDATDGWQMVATDDSPSPRLLVGATFDGARRRLVVYGGVESFFLPGRSDLWALDVTAPNWEPLHDGGGTAPGGRFFPAIVWEEKSDRYILFGGHDNTLLGNRNDTWSFDPDGLSWEQLVIGDTWANPQNGDCDFPADFADVDLASPERRSSHGMTVGDGQVWIFGGKTDCGAVDDVWSFDGQWHERTAAAEGEACLRFFAGTEYECQGMCL